MDWGRSQVHIRCQWQDGGTSWIVRIPCFLSTMRHSGDDGRFAVTFREKIRGRVVGIVCAMENTGCYNEFLGMALAAAREDGFLFIPSGELYVAVIGAFVAADAKSVLVRTDVPGGSFMLDYAHGGQDGGYRLYGVE